MHGYRIYRIRLALIGLFYLPHFIRVEQRKETCPWKGRVFLDHSHAHSSFELLQLSTVTTQQVEWAAQESLFARDEHPSSCDAASMSLSAKLREAKAEDGARAWRVSHSALRKIGCFF